MLPNTYTQHAGSKCILNRQIEMHQEQTAFQLQSEGVPMRKQKTHQVQRLNLKNGLMFKPAVDAKRHYNYSSLSLSLNNHCRGRCAPTPST